jgi:hypothetical protein
VQAKKAVIPVLLPGAPTKPELPLFLHNRTWVDLRQGWRDADVRQIVWGVRGNKPPFVGPDGGGGCGEAHGETHAMPAANPFDPWTPALPPRFCGREPLLRRLHHALDRCGSVSLLGDARTGKSSLLLTWAERARQAGRIVAVADGQGPEAASCWALVQALTSTPCGGAAREAAADVAADELSAWASSSGGLPPLLIIDEADAVLARLPYRFFERLRGMLGRICLLLATRHEIGEVARDDGRTSPLLNRLEVQRVGLLDEPGVNALLARGTGVLGAGDAATLRRFAGRHPFYLSLLAHYLWQARCGGESDEAAIEAFRDNAFQRLDEWSRALPARQHRSSAPCSGADCSTTVGRSGPCSKNGGFCANERRRSAAAGLRALRLDVLHAAAEPEPAAARCGHRRARHQWLAMVATAEATSPGVSRVWPAAGGAASCGDRRRTDGIG